MAGQTAAESCADFPPVLMYHDVRETPLNYFDVTVEDFRAHLDQLTPEERRREIADSKQLLEKWSGRKIESLAFPYGAYEKSVIREVRAAGYALSFTAQDRGLFHEPARYSIPRIYVGLELCRENIERFGDSVRSYREMPAALFVERWEPLPEKATHYWRFTIRQRNGKAEIKQGPLSVGAGGGRSLFLIRFPFAGVSAVPFPRILSEGY